MKIVEDTLYGTSNSDPRLPSPAEWIELLGVTPQPDITLDRSNATITVGDTLTLEATTTPAGKTVSWSSSASSKASVSNGVVTAEEAGSAVITASITVDGTTYSDTCAVTVVAAAEG
jgi:uncharacterized protein YjdB